MLVLVFVSSRECDRVEDKSANEDEDEAKLALPSFIAKREFTSSAKEGQGDECGEMRFSVSSSDSNIFLARRDSRELDSIA